MHQKPPVEQITDLMAAFRLVHVMRAGQNDSDAGCGKRMNFVPEFLPCLGVDTGGWFIEQE